MPDTDNTKKTMMFDGKTGEAGAICAKIFRSAKESITVIDTELSVRTLELISAAGTEVPVLIYSDNEGESPLTRQRLKNFFSKNPAMRMLIGTVAGKCRGRYIVTDSGTPEEKVYLLSASLSRAGEENACVIRMEDTGFMGTLLGELEKNAYLILK